MSFRIYTPNSVEDVKLKTLEGKEAFFVEYRTLPFSNSSTKKIF